ncbi:RHS repeat-associated core domain-containing protein [Tenacibaculum amylolyticum]|uniref:RHS repeat-associated core domain-containing protein n=1 Tax=Tenacibaculum amylolyticum TaxID=104269 RepID=UPI00389395DA
MKSLINTIILRVICFLSVIQISAQEIIWKSSSNFTARSNNLSTGSGRATGDAYMLSHSRLGLNATGLFSITGFQQNGGRIHSRSGVGVLGVYLTPESEYSLTEIENNSYAIVYDQGKRTVQITSPNREIATINSVSLVSRDVFTIEKTDANKIKLSFNEHSYLITDNFIENLNVVVRSQASDFAFEATSRGFSLAADPDYVGVTDTDKNWVWSRTFDNTGKVTSTGINYFDNLGKSTQSQTRDFKTNKNWASEVRYDAQGRPALQTLSAPINMNQNFSFKEDFIKKTNGTTYANSDFETDPEFPAEVGSQEGSLGYYYSNSNTSEPLQDIAEGRPYSKTVYDELNPGNVRAVVGGKIMNLNGQGSILLNRFPQGFSYTMPAAQEMQYIFGKNYFPSEQDPLGETIITRFQKTVNIDVNGIETVIFTDGQKVLATGRSGGTDEYEMVSVIGAQGYIDVHIPNGVTQFELFGNTNSITVYNIRTGKEVSPNTITGGNIYRIEGIPSSEVPGSDYTYISDSNEIVTVPEATGIRYQVNYHEFAVNYYDDANRLVKSTQPIGFDDSAFTLSNTTPNHGMATTYNYNAAGELLNTVSPDEGFAAFAYREDGQIRFSKNAKQTNQNEFSYTNYDDKARPIESGVSEGSVPYFPVNSIVVPILETDANVSATSGTVVKNNPGWADGGFHSLERTGNGDFKISFKSPYVLLGNLMGLSLEDHGDFYNTVERGIYFYGGYVRAMALGEFTPPLVPHNPESVYSIERNNGIIRYKKDGETFYTVNNNIAASNTINTDSFIIDGAMLEEGLSFTEIRIEQFANTAARPTSVDNWEVDPNQCKEQVFTSYDENDDKGLWLALYGGATNLPENYRKQEFLAGNVSKTWTENPVTSTTWYSYDVYGRVSWMVQNIEGLGVKTIDYVYDDRTGQVNRVVYQRDEASEMFIHRYVYNEFGQLLTVETSRDGNNYIEHARYSYYETGALKRTEIAEGLQGLDYIYTLNGQLKAINHPGLSNVEDPGEDQNDAFGLIIDYNRKDYTRANTGITKTFSGTDQYNGNIKGYRWATLGLQNAAKKGYLFDYNEKNWLTQASFKSITQSALNTDVYVGNDAGDYNVYNISYDANGNIRRLDRNKDSHNNTNAMDKLKYHYYNDGNKLSYVNDTSGNIDEVGDIKAQLPNNYIYNSIGQLIENKQDEIQYEYYTNGLVKSVRTTQSNSDKGVYFTYNDRGHRVSKRSLNGTGGGTQTYYVRDASGQVMGIYSTEIGTNPRYAVQYPVYGASRLGMATQANTFKYEITDHLGNVRAVIMKDASVPPVVDEQFTTNSVPSSITSSSNAVTSISSVPFGTSVINTNKQLKVAITNNATNHVKIPFQTEAGHTYAIKFYTGLHETTNALQYYIASTPTETVQKKRTAEQSGIKTFNYKASTTGQQYLIFELAINDFTDIITTNNYYLDTIRINDVTTENAPVMLAHKDYYPFGMPMPNRNIEGEYPYAYQGQEKDTETGMEAFELRLWDARIGRWLNPDPKKQFKNPYLGIGNDPVNSIDPDGGFKKKWWANIVNILIGGDGVSFNKKRDEFYVHKTTYLEGDLDKNELGGFITQQFYSNPIKLYGKVNLKLDHGLQAGLSLKFFGVQIDLTPKYDVTNIFDANLELNSKNGFNDSYIYDSLGDLSGGGYLNSKYSNTSGLGIGFGVVGGAFEYENSSFRSERILGGALRGISHLNSEELSFPVYGTIKTNYTKDSPVTTTTRSWSLGASLIAIFGVHANLEGGYELLYQVDK